MPDALVSGQDIDRNEECGARDDQQEKPQLVTGQCLFKPLLQHQEIQSEVDREQQHEHRDDDVNDRVAVGTHTGVSVGEAAGAGGGERVDKAVIQGHTGQLQQCDLSQRHNAVHGVQDLGGLGLLGHQLGEDGAGSFRLGQVVGADAQGGQKRRGQHQHAHAAQPVGEGSPEQNAVGHRLNIGQNGGTGGGETGDGLKKAVHEGIEAAGEEKGQRAHHAGGQPDKADTAKTLPGVELGPGLQFGQGEARGGGDGAGQQKWSGVLTVDEGYQHGEQHGARFDQDDLTDHLEYKL